MTSETRIGFTPLDLQIGDQGNWVAATGFEGANFLWHLPRGQPIGDSPGAAFDQSSDGRWIVTQGVQARCWDMEAGQPLATPAPLRHRNLILGVKFSPEGGRVLTVSTDNTARIWDARTGAPLTEPLLHSYQLVSGCWSPDGRRVATTALDQTLTLWDAHTGERLVGPLPCSQPLSLSKEERLQLGGFLADGRRVLVRTAGRADLFDLAPPASEPVPAWLAPLAEAVAGQRVERIADERGTRTLVHEVPFAERLVWREKFQTDTAADAYSRLARWFFAAPSTRGPFPSAPAIR